MIIFTPIAWALWRTLSGILSKKRRQCGMFRISNDRDKCMEKYVIMKYESVLKVLRKQLSECKTAKDPQKCNNKTSSMIQKLEKKIEEKTRKYNMRWS
jgi:hypothetical protein